MTTEARGALQGLRILDLTRVLAGPFCTMMLSDLGAEVVKIEQPGRGDDSRHFAPFRHGESAYYMNLNRGKRGVTLDLKGPGRELFLDLVLNADVVIENYRPGTMEKLGLGYEVLKEVNPRLVYAAVSGFGDSGPYRLRPGYDIIGQAMGGLMSTSGWPGGEPTRSTATPPARARRSTSRWSTRWSRAWKSSPRSTSPRAACRSASATATSPAIPTTRSPRATAAS